MTTNGAADDPRGPESAGVSAVLSLVLSTVGFFALAVFGLGLLSLATETDIIAVPGLGQAPGMIGMAAALAAFAWAQWTAVRQARPPYRSVWLTALITGFAHLVVVAVCVLVVAGDAVTALVVAGDLVRGGASAVLVLVAATAGWCGIALRRTRAQHPHWPWEGDDEE